MGNNFLNLSTDNTLGGNSPSDYKAPSEKAIKAYIDNLLANYYTKGQVDTKLNADFLTVN